jgi:cation:H+ antiporter
MMAIALLLLKFVLLSAIIVVAGTYLAKFGDEIADKSGLGGSLVGLILIAAATSLPELAVNCIAVRIPAADLALGAIVGSSLFNLLILGVMEFAHGTQHRIISPASSDHALSAICSLVVTACLAFFLLLGDVRLVGSIGLGPILVLGAYIYCLRLIYIDEQSRSSHVDDPDYAAGMPLRQACLGYLAMTAIIFGAAWYLAPTADALARESGLGGTFIGTTFVAISTSLPELVTTLAAVRMGAFDMAVGNVFGSNAFNAAMLLPIDACYAPGPVLADVSHVHAMTASAVMVITSVILVAMFSKEKRRYPLISPDALLVIVLALLSLVAVYFASTT